MRYYCASIAKHIQEDHAKYTVKRAVYSVHYKNKYPVIQDQTTRHIMSDIKCMPIALSKPYFFIKYVQTKDKGAYSPIIAIYSLEGIRKIFSGPANHNIVDSMCLTENINAHKIAAIQKSLARLSSVLTAPEKSHMMNATVNIFKIGQPMPSASDEKIEAGILEYGYISIGRRNIFVNITS